MAGFTPLTEALSAIGREGSEELTRLLNGYFTRMIGILAEEGGDVLRFGGDAMTVFFPGESRERAARGALRMMEAMAEFSDLPTRAGRFSLSMKIGAAHGAVSLGLVGDGTLGRDYYAAGLPLDEAAEAEHRSAPGRIILHPAFLAGARRTVETENLGDGYARLAGVAPFQASPLRSPDAPEPQALREVVPPHLAERAGEGILGEHRGTAVVFLGAAGLSWDDPAAAHETVERLFRLLAGAARRYQGTVNKVDFGDKGAKAILLFGAPFACERKEEMATRAALEVLASPDLPRGLVLRAGVTSAPLFSGPVGSPERREFTVMGDGINLAARLMAAAEPGRVLVSGEVARGAGASLRFAALPPVMVKGKRDPVPLFLPTGEAAHSPTAAEGLLFEREEAQARLREALFGGTPESLIVEGEPGLGKSALASWAQREARAREVPVILVPLAPFNAERPFSAWKAVIRITLGADKGDPPARLAALRETALAEEPSGFRPVLNPFLDLPDEETPALRGLAPRERKELTFAVVRRLLDRGGERLLLLDGLQWADPLSLDLLSFLFSEASAAPWRLAAFSRPGPHLSAALRRSAASLKLPPLTPSGTRALLAEAHHVAPVSEGVLGWFAEKARGNPILVAALVRSLEEEGLLRESAEGQRTPDADRLFRTAFPDTLEGLFLKRVDALSPVERLALQEASALGYAVSLNLLGRASALSGEERQAALSALVARGLLREDSRGTRPYLAFTDTLLRDAVYSAFPFAQRRAVHGRVLQALESEGGSGPGTWPALAHHAEQAGEEERARRFHRLAGRAALSRFDNASALRHLEFVCRKVSPERETVEDAFGLMDVYEFLGRWADASALLERLSPLDPRLSEPQRARLTFFSSREMGRAGRWEEAERALLRGLEICRKGRDVSGQGKTYVNLVGGVYGPSGRMDRAKECLEKALALPPGPDQGLWRATAAMNLGAVLWMTGRQEEALAAFLRAEQAARRGRLAPQRGLVADNLCALLGEMGRFQEACGCGRRAVRTLDTFAIRAKSLNARYNLALAFLAMGRVEEGRTLLLETAATAGSSGATQVLGSAHQGLLQAALLTGRVREALDHARRALELFSGLGAGRDYRFTLAGVGNLFYALNAPGEAAAFWRETRAGRFLARSPGDPVADLALERIRRWFREGPFWKNDPRAFLPRHDGGAPEEELERRLWVCEEVQASGDRTALRRWFGGLERALSRWPYFDARLRSLRLEAELGGGLSLGRRREALRLLSLGGGGLWGLRLAGTLWTREPDRTRAKALRQRGLRQIYALHAQSPPWAWERILAFPEVRALLRGDV